MVFNSNCDELVYDVIKKIRNSNFTQFLGKFNNTVSKFVACECELHFNK